MGAQHPHGSEGTGRWQSSPLRYMVENNQQMLRRRLAGRDAQIDFPILAELQAQGATDYLARLSRFARDDSPVGIPGMLTSWVSDRDGGFRDDDVDAILACIPALGLACYRIVLQTVANDLLVAYLGPNAGHRVLGGQVQRGSVTTLSAALMFADLRGFTAVADRTPSEQLVAWLNDSFDAIVEPVEAHGGEVLKFLGDGLLATFGFTSEDRQRACATALAAAEAGLERTAALNREREKVAAPALQLDVALHVGDVMYGNVGSSGRLDFTIIGPAVNEVCRMEALCEPLGAHLLVSADFADGCGRPMVSLGRHRLKGIATPRELFCAGR